MAKREEEAHAQRMLATLDNKPRAVIDSRNMVGVEGVAQTEAVGECARAGVDRTEAAGVVEKESPAKQVQQTDEAVHGREPPNLAAREGETKRTSARSALGCSGYHLHRGASLHGT